MKMKFRQLLYTLHLGKVIEFYDKRFNPFYRAMLKLLVVLTLVRYIFPSVAANVGAAEKTAREEPKDTVPEIVVDEQAEARRLAEEQKRAAEEQARVAEEKRLAEAAQQAGQKAASEPQQDSATTPVDEVSPVTAAGRHWHRVGQVSSYDEEFGDVQDVQIVAARKWGVKPPHDRAEAERRKKDLVYVGMSPYFHLDPSMRNSIPYLVPRASNLLTRIGRNFFDSLYVKGLPLHKIIVSSVLRSEQDVAKLAMKNGNVSTQSCHRFGTTFDVCWTRFHTVNSKGFPHQRQVRDDTLKFVLSEVLRDLRNQGLCYVKHEAKQSCFHITVR